MTQLIQILLPRFDEAGKAFEHTSFEKVKQELAQRFGGVTAFVRASAQGLWKTESGELISDEVAVFEVMVEEIDAGWWSSYRRRLELRFSQDEIVIRSNPIRRL